jgi:hypothetical protein
MPDHFAAAPSPPEEIPMHEELSRRCKKASDRAAALRGYL